MDMFANNPHSPLRVDAGSLTEDEAIILGALEFSHIYVAGADARVPQRFLDDSEGAFPIFIGRSSSWKDTISGQLDRFSPLVGQRVHIRLWCESVAMAKRFETEIPAKLSSLTNKLRGNWYDLRVGTDLLGLQIVLQELGDDLGIMTYDDIQLKQHIRTLINTSAV